MHEPDANLSTVNGSAAFAKSSKPPQPRLFVPPGRVAFRLLCHASRVGGVIGKSGSIIKQIQQSTNSKVRIEDSNPGNPGDHRVIAVIGSSIVIKRITINDTEQREEEEGVGVSAAQEGLLRVFERVMEVAADGVMAVEGLVSCRLLVGKNQVGAVIGKGGKVVEKIRYDTGCRVKVLNSERLPSCALPTDEIIEIEGDILAVKKALIAVSSCLQEFPPVEKTWTAATRPFEPVTREISSIPTVSLPCQKSSMVEAVPFDSNSYASGDCPLTPQFERVSGINSRKPKQEMIFKILSPNDRVGGIIGKGGSIIKTLQSETGASICVGPSLAECDERLITITAMESPGSKHSPAQDGAILVFKRSVEAAIENGLDAGSDLGPVSVRLVVPSNQVGCLLGKGGTIISEIRKVTRTSIRVLRSEQVPIWVSETDQIVQITGEFDSVQAALYNVTGRLRDNIFSSKFLTGAGTRSNSLIKENGPHNGSRGPPNHGSHPSIGLSYKLNQHAHLVQDMNHLGITAAAEAFSDSNPQHLGGESRKLSKGGIELGSGSRSAIVTNSTVEIEVPDDIIRSIYRENGSNLARLKLISGAKVTVHEPCPAKNGRTVVISGTPEETHAAQSLLQAFLINGSF